MRCARAARTRGFVPGGGRGECKHVELGVEGERKRVEEAMFELCPVRRELGDVLR